MLEPAVEDRQHGGARGAGALLGEEQPVAGLLERGRAVEARRCRSGASARAELLDEARPGRPSASASSERRKACRCSCGLRSSSPRRSSSSWRGRSARAGRRRCSSRRCSPGISAGSQAGRSAQAPCRSATIRADLGGVDVVAEHEPLEPLAGSRGSARRARPAGSRAGERRPARRVGRRRRSPSSGSSCSSGAWAATCTLARDQHLAHAAAERRGRARSPSSCSRRRRRRRRPRPRRPAATGIATTTAGRAAAHEAAVVARDAVRDAVDLDQQVGALRARSRVRYGAPPSVSRRS